MQTRRITKLNENTRIAINVPSNVRINALAKSAENSKNNENKLHHTLALLKKWLTKEHTELKCETNQNKELV